MRMKLASLDMLRHLQVALFMSGSPRSTQKQTRVKKFLVLCGCRGRDRPTCTNTYTDAHVHAIANMHRPSDIAAGLPTSISLRS